MPALTSSTAPPPRSQALCISVLEEQLYLPSHQEAEGEAMYPPYLVIATSALGLAAARKLLVGGWGSHPLCLAVASPCYLDMRNRVHSCCCVARNALRSLCKPAPCTSPCSLMYPCPGA